MGLAALIPLKCIVGFGNRSTAQAAGQRIRGFGLSSFGLHNEFPLLCSSELAGHVEARQLPVYIVFLRSLDGQGGDRAVPPS